MTEVDPNDKSINKWVVLAHRYDPETRHFRYLPIAAYTTQREFKRRFKLESDELQNRRLKGVAHIKEEIVGRWTGVQPPPVAIWKKTLRFLFGLIPRKKYIQGYEQGYAEYEAFLRGEELKDDY